MLIEETDRSVVANCCKSVGLMLQFLGPDLLMSQDNVETDDIYECVIGVARDLLSGDHPSLKFGEGFISEDYGSRTADEEPLENISILLEGLCNSLGPQFQLFFAKIHEFILKLAAHPDSVVFRSSGLGVYAEALLCMGVNALAYADQILPYALRAAAEEDEPLLRHNAVFCLGALAEHSQTSPGVKAALVNIIDALKTILNMDKTHFMTVDREMFDNAVSALGRYIVFAPDDDAVPHAITVPLFLNSMPIQEDFTESDNVLKTLLYLAHCGKIPGTTNSFLYMKALTLTLCNPRSNLKPDLKEQGEQLLRALVPKVQQSELNELGRYLVETKEEIAVGYLQNISQPRL
eukprot:CAMPEP_0113855924 /NCGR_PEP_ID=MMETSP0372-20130328/8721_1 /TAXON_ID=340204 /ORGANISM="Lankesteria abbotti" /LENGTH=348 /DNA_ID=CAMNT_0000830409 /DNA_START=880 /DNA_END=1926 /DNA_ORIENTATION=- /assembly_acc=CAM_ASM_000359